MSYDYPCEMTKDEIETVCSLITGDEIIIQRCLRGRWKEEKVIYIDSTRFALHVLLNEKSYITLKWDEYGDRWRNIKREAEQRDDKDGVL